jgi:hypothetical protein
MECARGAGATDRSAFDCSNVPLDGRSSGIGCTIGEVNRHDLDIVTFPVQQSRPPLGSFVRKADAAVEGNRSCIRCKYLELNACNAVQCGAREGGADKASADTAAAEWRSNAHPKLSAMAKPIARVSDYVAPANDHPAMIHRNILETGSTREPSHEGGDVIS